MKMLLVEDEQDLRTLMQKRLKKEFTIDACKNGQEALDYLECYSYDIILLDIMLPYVDGITVLKKLRSRKIRTPVLLLTAKSSISERVEGLDAGADDYLVKPFAFDELQARIRVLLRRNTETMVTDILSVADLSMNVTTRTVSRSGQPISLSQKEYMLLEYMLRNAGSVLSRDQLEQRVWSGAYEGGSNIVDVYIRYLRKKIDHGFDQKLIHTVHGRGYCLEERKS